MSIEVDATWTRPVLQFAIGQPGEGRTDIRFQNQTDPKAHARQAFYNAAAHIVSFNFRSLLR